MSDHEQESDDDEGSVELPDDADDDEETVSDTELVFLSREPPRTINR